MAGRWTGGPKGVDPPFSLSLHQFCIPAPPPFPLSMHHPFHCHCTTLPNAIAQIHAFPPHTSHAQGACKRPHAHTMHMWLVTANALTHAAWLVTANAHTHTLHGSSQQMAIHTMHGLSQLTPIHTPHLRLVTANAHMHMLHDLSQRTHANTLHLRLVTAHAHTYAA